MLKRKLKTLVSVMICCLFCFSIVSFAENDTQAEKEIIPERYTTISSKSCSLSISGINSTSFAVLRTSGSTNLKIKMELQKMKSGTYTTIETWNSTRILLCIHITQSER